MNLSKQLPLRISLLLSRLLLFSGLGRCYRLLASHAHVQLKASSPSRVPTCHRLRCVGTSRYPSPQIYVTLPHLLETMLSLTLICELLLHCNWKLYMLYVCTIRAVLSKTAELMRT